MSQQFSVLMSLYQKEKADYARDCFESLLSQTVPADEWVIVEDGPLTVELYDLLDEYQERYPNLIRRVPLKENVGLGLALQHGVKACKYDLIARMDTDDICRKDRFEKQLAEFEKDGTLDICGSQIEEFVEDPGRPVSRRLVPLHQDEIVSYQKRRDAFNHMTVMFKKQAVLEAGNYQSCLLMEDTLLWAKMLKNGAKGCNIDDDLVYVRTNPTMFERRGGLDYFKKYREGRKKVLETGFISRWEYASPLAVQFAFAVMPNKVRSFLYRTILRK